MRWIRLFVSAVAGGGRGISWTGWVVLEEGCCKDPHTALPEVLQAFMVSKEALTIHKSRQEIIVSVTTSPMCCKCRSRSIWRRTQFLSFCIYTQMKCRLSALIGEVTQNYGICHFGIIAILRRVPPFSGGGTRLALVIHQHGGCDYRPLNLN